MALPIIFANLTGQIPLSDLDNNFSTPITIGSTNLVLGGSIPSLPSNAGGTGLTSTGTAGNVLTSTGAGWVSSPASGGGGSGTVTSVGGGGTVNGITLSGVVTTAGSLTLGGALTGVNLTTQVTGTLPVGNGGTGVATTPVNGALDIGNGTGFTRTTLTPGTGIGITNTAGAITITATGAGVSSISAGTTGLTPSTPTTGAVVLGGTLAVANGGTGTPTPSLVPGTNITSITGTWPNQTINASGGSGMTYPALGIPNSTGAAWGTSYSTTGSGSAIALATSPTLIAPILGTPASGNLTNCTFPILNQSTIGNAATASAVPYTGLTGTVPTWNQNTIGTASGLSSTLAVTSGGTGVTTGTGTGSNVLNTSPTLITPILGTPASGNLTNCTFPTASTSTSGTVKVDGTSITVAAGVISATTINALGVTYTPSGTGAVNTTAQSKFKERVSVFDFMTAAQIADVQSFTASIDCYGAFQAATNYLQGFTYGGVLYIPSGGYLISGGTITNDRSANSSLGRVSYQGSDENSTIIKYTGSGANCFYLANAHSGGSEPAASYQRISDLSIFGPTSRTNSCGVTMNLGAFAKFERLNIQGFDYGMYLQDVDQAYFEKVNLRFNNHGLWGLRNPSPGAASTEPNNWTFSSCTIGNNGYYGAYIAGGSAINFIGGDIEYNGATAGASGYGIQLFDSGYEGGVGAVFHGVYFEGNNGTADVVLTGTTVNTTPMLGVTHTLTGCTFHRNGTNLNTNNILCNFGSPTTVGQQQLILSGCAFKTFNTYVPSALRPNIAYSGTAASAANFFNLGSLFTSSVEKPSFIASTTPLSSVTTLANNPITGTPSTTNFLRGDGTWASPIVANGAYTNVSNTFTAYQSFGATSPQAIFGNYFKTATTGDSPLTVSNDGTGASAISANISTNSTTGFFCNFVYGPSTGTFAQVGSISYIRANNLVYYTNTSDYRLKENVVAISDSINRIKNLRPIRYNWIDNPTGPAIDGFLAHEVQLAVPEAIVGTKDEVDEKGNPKYQGIDQAKIVPLLTAALQEAIARIEALEAK